MRLSDSVAETKIITCRDAADLSERAAQEFVRLARQAIQSAGRFTVALSGGSTPKALYTRLASADYAEQIHWERAHLFWGDERCVGPDHSESNYRMVRESLLANISIPAENVHRMAGEKDPQVAALEYEAELRGVFELKGGALPRFDLILLGLGDDGHTASLFPGSEALNVTEHLVAVAYVEKLKAHRLTLTFPVLNEGAEIVFLIAGASKAAVVKDLFGRQENATNYPAARIQPRAGKLVWMITADAAPGRIT
jgi:6-phosphogluconolactonase